MVHTQCKRCSWRFDPSEPNAMYCGMCGTQAVKMIFANNLDEKKVQFNPDHGFIFYPRTDQSEGTEFEIIAMGNKSLPIQIKSTRGFCFKITDSESALCDWTYQFSGKLNFNADHSYMSQKLDNEIKNLWKVHIRLDDGFPDDNAHLEVYTPLELEPIYIPLVSSSMPRWQLIYSDIRLKADSEKTAHLYPEDSNQEFIWDCRLIPEGGSGFIEDIRLEQEYDEQVQLELNRPSNQSRLVKPGENYLVKINWKVNNKLSPKNATVLLKLRSVAEPIQFPIKVYPTPQIDLYLEAEKADSETIIQTDTETIKHVLIRNHGAADGNIEKLEVLSDHIALFEVILEDQQKGKRHQHCDNLHTLPESVKESFLLDGDGNPKPIFMKDNSGLLDTSTLQLNDEMMRRFRVNSIGLKVAPKIEIDDEVIRGVIRFTIRPIDQFGVLSDSTITLDEGFSFRARKVDKIAGNAGYLLIDYGTVHTCAVGVKKENLESIPIVFEFDNKQFKSVLRLKRSRALEGEFDFGEEVWENIAPYIKSVDFAAKLRLGTNERRCLRDFDNTIRLLSGQESTEIYLSEVLRRARVATGYDFEKIYLTSPAAFAGPEREQLLEALKNIGYEGEDQVELVCTEPEAYLKSVAGDSTLNAEIVDFLGDSFDSKLGYVFDFGGGTTDITIFELDQMDGFNIITSYGYRHLGGEALTQLIAKYIYDEIPAEEKRLIPFPEFSPGELFLISDASSVGEIHNFGEIRRQAENLKCSSSWDQMLALDLRSDDLSDTMVEVSINQDALDVYIQRGLLDPAIEDLTNRMSLMYRAGCINEDTPEIIIVAGNSGMLRGLKEYLVDVSESLGKEPLYLYNQEAAKLGVVEGLKLAAQMQETLLPINEKPVIHRWIYLSNQGDLELMAPAGTPRNIGLPIEDHLYDESFLQLIEDDRYFLSSPLRITNLKDRILEFFSSDQGVEIAKGSMDGKVKHCFQFTIKKDAIPRGIYRAALRYIDDYPFLYLKACNLRGTMIQDSDWFTLRNEE